MEENLVPLSDKLPSDFMKLYNLAGQVENAVNSGVLSYYALITYQDMINLHMQIIVKSGTADSLQMDFRLVQQQIKKLLQEDLKIRHPISVLLQLKDSAFSIRKNIENAAMSIGQMASRKKSQEMKRYTSMLISKLLYLTRLGITYSKYFDDTMLSLANETWRKYTQLIDVPPMQIITKPVTNLAITPESVLFMNAINFKVTSAISDIKRIADSLKPLMAYEDPDSTGYSSRFLMEFANMAVKSAVPIKQKQEDQNGQ